MYDTQMEGTVCLFMAGLVFLSTMWAPGISIILALLSLTGLSIYYLLVKKSDNVIL